MMRVKGCGPGRALLAVALLQIAGVLAVGLLAYEISRVRPAASLTEEFNHIRLGNTSVIGFDTRRPVQFGGSGEGYRMTYHGDITVEDVYADFYSRRR